MMRHKKMKSKKGFVWMMVLIMLFSFVLPVNQSVVFAETTTTITTIAGTGDAQTSGDDSPAINAAIKEPTALAFDGNGNLYIVCPSANLIRKIDPTGDISTFAGTGVAGFSGDDGQASSARLNNPTGIAIDPAGNVYIADNANHRVRKVNTEGIISTIAGTGANGDNGDEGLAIVAALGLPTGIAVYEGAIYVSTGNNKIKKFTEGGTITTLAGLGFATFQGDGGQATQAYLNRPWDMTIDSNGDLLVSDQLNHVVRKINHETGIISRIAGIGQASGSTGDGEAATNAKLNRPAALAFDQLGNLYVADQYNHKIRIITTDSLINTLAGTGVNDFSGDDGSASSATFSYPSGLAFDSNGNLYVADTYNNRIRKITITHSDSDPDPTPITHTITFDINEGEGIAPDPIDVTEGLSWNILPGVGDMSKAGLDFGGWTTEANNLATIVNDNEIPTGDLTLYAFWEAKPLASWSDEVANAVLGTDYNGGDGTYDIYTAKGLAWLANEVNTGGFSGYHAELEADIDLSGKQWVPIGNYDNPYEATFDGQGYKITGMEIGSSAVYNTTLQYAGLFGSVSGGKIANLNLETAAIYVSKEFAVVAPLVANNRGTVENCFAGGVITAYENNNMIGGLIGYNESGNVINSHAAVSITNLGVMAAIGGLVGQNDSNIQNSYSLSDLTNFGLNSDLGGFVGYIGDGSTAQNCYAVGNIISSEVSNVGGFAGYCYSLTQINDNDKFWNANASQTVNDVEQTPKKGIGFIDSDNEGKTVNTVLKTAAEMKAPDFIAGLNTWVTVNQSTPASLHSWLEDESNINQGFPILDTDIVISTVELSSGSLGVAGNTKITGLTTGNKYKIIVNSETKYVKADGTLSDTEADVANLTGTEITGLSNGTSYKVEAYTLPSWSEEAATAVEGTDYIGGDGAYDIYTAKGLAWLANEVNIGNFSGDHAELEADIDLAGKQWIPIGNYDNSFEAIFEGNGHKITGLEIGTVEDPDNNYTVTGLFGYADSATIRNLSVAGNIYSTYSGSCIGLAVGESLDTSIYNCSTSGKIYGGANAYIGGIIGYLQRSFLYNSFSTADVAGTTVTSAGGAIGTNSNSEIGNIYCTGKVMVESTQDGIGAVVGAGVGIYSNENILWNSEALYMIGGEAVALMDKHGDGGDSVTDESFPKTIVQLKSQSVLDGLNAFVATDISSGNSFDTKLAVWEEDLDTINQGFPVLDYLSLTSPDLNSSATLTSNTLTIEGTTIYVPYSTSYTTFRAAVTIPTGAEVKLLFTNWAAYATDRTKFDEVADQEGTSILDSGYNVVAISEDDSSIIKYDIVISSVGLSNDSLGVVGNTKITGLTTGNKYKVTVGGSTKYVKANGTLSNNEADVANLTGTEITGLTNGTSYKVEVYTPTPVYAQAFTENQVSVTRTESALIGLTLTGATAFDSFKFELRLSTDPAPTRAEMIALDENNTFEGPDDMNTLEAKLPKDDENLTANTNYKLYMIAKSGADYQEDITSISFTTKQSAPAFGEGKVTVTDITDTSASINVDWEDTDGEFLIMILPSVYTDEWIHQHMIIWSMEQGLEGAYMSSDGKLSATIATDTGGDPLVASTAYKAVIVGFKDVVDHKGNSQASATIIPFTTLSEVPPTTNLANGSLGSAGNNKITGLNAGTKYQVVILVNGKSENAGTETKSTEEGKSVVTVEVNNLVIEDKIEEAIKGNLEGSNNMIQVPIADTKSDVAKVELTGDIIKKLEENSFDLSIKRDDVEYLISAEEFTISNVAKDLGVAEASLKDIKIEVKITKLDEAVVEKYNEMARANGAELVFPPIEFEIIARTTNADGISQDLEINKFNNYVERIMEIPADVDASKITTGIVFNEDGTYSHVPTEVFQKEGKWYAKLNSLTNSNYSVVWNPIIVKSVQNHWSKQAVNDLASRLVIFNAETFEPDKAITRGDFAEYIVRALGLFRVGSTYESKFNDVNETGDRTLAILIAHEYGIVSGYLDGNFRPNQMITREEAMAMCQRAMKLTKLMGNDPNKYQEYKDFNLVGQWATTYVKDVIAGLVFKGTSLTTISPKSSLTYAEAAQAIQNLLVEAKLINKQK